VVEGMSEGCESCGGVQDQWTVVMLDWQGEGQTVSVIVVMMKCQEAVRKSSVVGGIPSQARDRDRAGCCAFYCNACPLPRVSRARSNQGTPPSLLHQLWHMATRRKAYANRCIQTVALETLLPCILCSPCHTAAVITTPLTLTTATFIVSIAACVYLLSPQLNIACPTEAKYQQHRPRPSVPALLCECQCSAFVFVKTTPQVRLRHPQCFIHDPCRVVKNIVQYIGLLLILIVGRTCRH
jgi:hypothetical protein